jgi:hypothetical protein
MVRKLAIAGAVLMLFAPTTLSAQGVGGAVNAGAAVRGAVVQGIPTPKDLGASSSSYYRGQHKQSTAQRKPRRSQ